MNADNQPQKTSIPNAFIDGYLAGTKSEYIAVYLYGIRWQSLTPSLRKTAADLNMRELDVVAAWTYWESAGFVRITDGSLDNFAFEFTVTDGVESGEAPVSSSRDAERETAAALEQTGRAGLSKPAGNSETDILEQITGAAQGFEKARAGDGVKERAAAQDKPARHGKRPQYEVPEIERAIDSSEDVRYIFKMAERIYGRPLTYSDMNLLVGFYDWLQLPAQVIEVLLDYCVNAGHRNGRYIEKVAVSWADSGVTTVDEAEAYIHTYNVDFREILKAFGQARRDPTPKEIVFMRKWLFEYKMPMELITEACGKALTETGVARFTYADSILAGWHKAGVATLDEAKSYDDEYREKHKRGAQEGVPGKKSRFAGYKGREWDFDELEKLAAEKSL